MEIDTQATISHNVHEEFISSNDEASREHHVTIYGVNVGVAFA